MVKFSIDVGIIGAGLAGLTCARILRDKGFQVLLLDKSRGVGGRIATRRFSFDDREVSFDHGLPYFTSQGVNTERLRDILLNNDLIRLGRDDNYIAPDGMNSIAKFLARDLAVERGFTVTTITAKDGGWSILSPEKECITVKILVITIPAPQAITLLASSGLNDVFPSLTTVTYDPCLTVIAGYENPYPEPRKNRNLRWVGIDSEKRVNPPYPVVVLHSDADFAHRYFEADLEGAKNILIGEAGLEPPLWSRIHRWRYALPRKGLELSYLESIDPLPLYCGGDWCTGELSIDSPLEAAITSGKNIGERITALFTPY